MKTERFLLLAIAALGLVACNDDQGLLKQPSGTSANELAPDAYAAFSIKIPGETLSKAAATDPGIAAENTIKTLYIFMYDTQSPYTPTVMSFSTTDGSLAQKSGTTNEWITTQAVRTKKVDKYIFAGVNLTQAIVDQITSKGYGAFNYQPMAQEVADLSDFTNGFVMFNAVFPSVTPATDLFDSEATALNSHLSILVDRVVAKASVGKGSRFVVNGGGEMTDLKYGWRNLNKQFYLVQQVADGWIKDYNWDTYSSSDFTVGTDALDMIEVGVSPSVFSYTTENAFNYRANTSRVDAATYLTVQGVFKPDQVVQLVSVGTNPSTHNDFQTVANPSAAGTDFYVVRTDDGISNYFIDAATATAYATLCINKAEGMPALTGEYNVGEHTYSGGLCYYHLFVNGNAVAPQAPYNVYRNQYYKVTINSIQAPGNPSDNFDQGKPIVSSAWLGVDIEVNPWVLVEEGQDL